MARASTRCSATPKSAADLGPAFGPELTAAEVRYLMTKEWARFPDDILWRRSKLGLTMPPADRDALAAFMAAATLSRDAPSAWLISQCFRLAPPQSGARHPQYCVHTPTPVEPTSIRR